MSVVWKPTDMLEIGLARAEDFLLVKETLERIGIAAKDSKRLTQTCHILFKQGKYYIVHFKEMFAIDGKPTTLSEDDLKRRNRIATLLLQWGLIESIKSEIPEEMLGDMKGIKVVRHGERAEWEFVQKYQIGRKQND